MNTFKQRYSISVRFLAFILLFLTPSVFAAKPDHLVIMVFDAMRPDFISRFAMKHMQGFAKKSTTYSQAHVGYVGSETVVAHAVIPTGLPPSNQAWGDDIFKDVDGVLGKPGAFYLTGDLTGEQFHKLQDSVIPRERHLGERVRAKLGGKFFAVGGKPYAAYIFGGPSADSIITHKKSSGLCKPSGINVPEYISNDDRFTLECKNDHGTKDSFYPLDGDRLISGNNKDHLGGDVWVADIATKIIANEKDWRALFLTFPSIDKSAHILGEHEGPRSHNFTPDFKFEDVVRTADAQFAKVVEALKQKKLLDRTMIVITADHGGQANESYLGTGDGQSHFGEIENDHSGQSLSFWMKRILALTEDKIQAGFADSAVRLWLKNSKHMTWNEKIVLAKKLAEVSGVTEVYLKSENSPHYKNPSQKSAPATTSGYVRIVDQTHKQSQAFRQWAKAHSQRLLDTAYSERSPDVVALLADGFGFGLLGEHGGTQEKVQRVPLIVFDPGAPALSSKVNSDSTTLADIASIVAKKMGL